MTAARAFTLIELLIVVAVVAILAAIALPNLLEAQVRANVSAAKGNMRTAWIGLQQYQVDHIGVPPTTPVFPDDPLGVLADRQLWRLTTPVAYITPGAFADPFGQPRMYSLLPVALGATPTDPRAFPFNPGKSLLYTHYRSSASRIGNPQLAVDGCSLVSIGPDGEDSLGSFAGLSRPAFLSAFVYAGVTGPVNTVYDPTNGSRSKGDIVLVNTGRFAGAQ